VGAARPTRVRSRGKVGVSRGPDPSEREGQGGASSLHRSEGGPHFRGRKPQLAPPGAQMNHARRQNVYSRVPTPLCSSQTQVANSTTAALIMIVYANPTSTSETPKKPNRNAFTMYRIGLACETLCAHSGRS